MNPAKIYSELGALDNTNIDHLRPAFSYKTLGVKVRKIYLKKKCKCEYGHIQTAIMVCVYLGGVVLITI